MPATATDIWRKVHSRAISRPRIDAARGRPVGLLSSRFKRLLLPDRRAGFAIDRGHQAMRILRVEDAVDHDRRGPQVGARPQVGERAHQPVAHRGSPPHDPQILDVVAVDLIERGIPGEALVAAERPPFCARGPLLGSGDDRGSRGQAHEQAGERASASSSHCPESVTHSTVLHHPIPHAQRQRRLRARSAGSQFADDLSGLRWMRP